MSTQIEQVISKLSAMYPELAFAPLTSSCLEGYGDAAKLPADLPEEFVAVEIHSTIIFDARSNSDGAECDPSDWGLSQEADALMFAYNKVRLHLL